MDSNVKLGRVKGIPVSLHWSWFVIFIFITWSLVGMFTLVDMPQQSALNIWVAALVTSILFFSSVLLHEFGHAFAAIKYNIPVKSISLFLLGGMAQIGQEPESPKAEFQIAAAGPLVSLLLAGFFGLIQIAFVNIPLVHSPSLWLARVNLLLAAFNMIPGYPMDGGRVLRAVIWHFTRSSSRAHKIAASGGQMVAFCFIAYGIFAVLGGNMLSGLWMAFVGWYLNTAAASSSAPNTDNPALSRIKVSQVMETGIRNVPASMSVLDLVNKLFIPHGFDLFTISEDGTPVGVLSMHTVASVPRAEWPKTSLRQVMVPLERVTQVHPDMNIQLALQAMDQKNLSHVTVHDGKSTTGVITRDQIHHYLALLGELGVH